MLPGSGTYPARALHRSMLEPIRSRCQEGVDGGSDMWREGNPGPGCEGGPAMSLGLAGKG